MSADLRKLAEEWLMSLESACEHKGHHAAFCVCVERALTRLLESVVRETAAAVLTAYPCTCGPDYTRRGMTAPDCFRCVALEAGVEQALSRWGLE